MTNVERLIQFSNRKYLNLVTYRKSGAAVATPLWFVEEGGVLYVRTPARSGKVKRLRNNPRVRAVPSDRRGNPKGVWIDGRARIVGGAEAGDDRCSRSMNNPGHISIFPDNPFLLLVITG